MRFWDTSAIVPLLAGEARTSVVIGLLREDADMAVWWGTRIECVSALARIEREGDRIEEALARLDALAEAWHELEPTEHVRRLARRLLRVHPLCAAAAVQLAAATIASEGDPTTLPFVCLDDRLALAASREGFPLALPAGDEPRIAPIR